MPICALFTPCYCSPAGGHAWGRLVNHGVGTQPLGVLTTEAGDRILCGVGEDRH